MVRVPRPSMQTHRTRPNPDTVLVSSPSRPSRRASSRSTHVTFGDTRLKLTPVLDELYSWVVARHEIYCARVLRRPADEWTDDAILKRYKFTNVFRELDRVTQYEIRHVIDPHPAATATATAARSGSDADAIREAVFRVLIFKIFNRPSTWELLNESEVGPVSWKTFDFGAYKKVLDRAHAKGVVLYNTAYQILPPMEFRDYKDCPTTWSKHLKLVALMMEEGLPEDLMTSNTIEEVRSAFLSDACTNAVAHSLLAQAYWKIYDFYSMADFLGFQYVLLLTAVTYTYVGAQDDPRPLVHPRVSPLDASPVHDHRSRFAARAGAHIRAESQGCGDGGDPVACRYPVRALQAFGHHGGEHSAALARASARADAGRHGTLTVCRMTSGIAVCR